MGDPNLPAQWGPSFSPASWVGSPGAVMSRGQSPTLRRSTGLLIGRLPTAGLSRLDVMQVTRDRGTLTWMTSKDRQSLSMG